MRYTEENEDNFDEDYEDYEDEYEDIDMIAIAAANREEEIKLANKHLRHDLLDKAISISKSNLFWWFTPHSIKLHRLVEAYETMRKLTGE